MRLGFNPKSHQYLVEEGGQSFRVPSVTAVVSVLDKSGPLLGWAAGEAVALCKGAIKPDTEYSETFLEAVWEAAKRAHRERKKAAADTGTQAHDAIHSRLERDRQLVWDRPGAQSDNAEVRDDQPEAVQNCLRAAGGWWQEHHVEVIELERPIYSRSHRYSGRCDLFCSVDGRLSLVDWKSSKSLHPEYAIQTAAYVRALEEELRVEIPDRWLIRLGKDDGAFEAKLLPRESLENDWQIFLALLTVKNLLPVTESLFKRTNEAEDAGSSSIQGKSNLRRGSRGRSSRPDTRGSGKYSGERRKRKDGQAQGDRSGSGAA